MQVLVIGFVWPEPTSSAAGVRTLQLIDILLSWGWKVAFSTPCSENEHRSSLEKKGVETSIFEPNDPSFDAYLKRLSPEIVFFDRFMIEEQFSWRVKSLLPGALRVLDTVDLHSLRRTRQEKVGKHGYPVKIEAQDLFNDAAFREISAIFRSHLSLVVSDFELAWLKDCFRVPAELVALCRMFEAPIASNPDFRSRADFVTIGNFKHPPNSDSYRLLETLLWDKIRARLSNLGIEAELHIYGAYFPSHVPTRDGGARGIRVKGWTENAKETLSQYRVNLAPLRFGAGIKGKISSGWSAGTPCVTTSIGAEGMLGSLPFGGAIEDDWEHFADQAVSLYHDECLWELAREQGFFILKSLYDRNEISRALKTRIEKAASEAREPKMSDFVGAMLWHHGNRSTEFFSRWIEEKNKNKKVEKAT